LKLKDLKCPKNPTLCPRCSGIDIKKKRFNGGGKRKNSFAVIGDRFPLLPQNIFFLLAFFPKVFIISRLFKKTFIFGA